MRVLVIDNMDSFTWNLVGLCRALGCEVVVHRIDLGVPPATLLDDADSLIISPGPGSPAAAPVAHEAIRWCERSRTPLLGVCLGYQCLALYFGCRIQRDERPVHGYTSDMTHAQSGIFAKLPALEVVMRYHSLVIDPESVPPELEVTARTTDSSRIMAIRHRTLPFEGVQFHPESFRTPNGRVMIENFLTMKLDR